jgi:hypothetical protein
MHTTIRIALLVLIGLIPSGLYPQGAEKTPQNSSRSPVRLLPGYTIELGSGAEGQIGGSIKNKNGLAISFHSFDMYSKDAVTLVKQSDIAWRSQQIIGGRSLTMVCTRANDITITLGDGTNFGARIRTSQEMADLLLMAVTYDEKKGYPVASKDITVHGSNFSYPDQ